MNTTPAQPGPRRLPPSAVPTLTEVVEALELRPSTAATEAGTDAAVAPDPGAAPDATAGVPPSEESSPALAPAVDEELLVQRVLLEIQRHVDLMIEFRLREALAPVLARAAQTIIDEAHSELSTTLRDVVGRAVAQEMARRRSAP